MRMFQFHPVIRIRMILQFITTLATMSVLPFLIIFFSEQLGTFITGFLFICVMGANILGSFVGGYISDRIGRKKVIVLGEFIVCISFVGAALVNSPWYTYPYITFLLFIMIQFSTGATTPVYQALIIDVSNPDNRKSIYTYVYWLRNMATANGSMIGAFLFYDYHFYLFLGVAMCTLFSLVITYIYIEETYTPTKQIATTTTMERMTILTRLNHVLQTYGKTFAHRFFLILTIATFLLVSVEEQLTNYIGVRLVDEIQDPVPFLPFLPFTVDGMNIVGMLKTTNTLIVVFCTMLITWLLRRVNEKLVLLTGLGLFFIGYTVISYSTLPLLLIIAMILASIGEIMYAPIQQTMLANTVPDNERSTYMAVYAVAAIFGVSTAGVFLIISSWIPPIVLTSIIAMMGLISTALLFQLTRSIKYSVHEDGVKEKEVN
ncbi:MFS transporter, DHA1 family, multidrug resistance protein B [Oceanobacillus limi]|uniref:MFS transporter, DHA1 family, multidrug resistance protein B n=1 Tax=Oceanobacillus limi TaxID=930131 RepID=A0A1I0G4N5_9BACI|nr:MFS transporter [Oceanobacillus limi]SET64981.1 MFS transporter, DHA1 family, multidrug resistance protein B [Oceanobacillus limi]